MVSDCQSDTEGLLVRHQLTIGLIASDQLAYAIGLIVNCFVTDRQLSFDQLSWQYRALLVICIEWR